MLCEINTNFTQQINTTLLCKYDTKIVLNQSSNKEENDDDDDEDSDLDTDSDSDSDTDQPMEPKTERQTDSDSDSESDYNSKQRKCLLTKKIIDLTQSDDEMNDNIQEIAFPEHITFKDMNKFKENDKFDYRDGFGQVCAVKIIKKCKTKLKIHYIGWSQRYDQEINYRKDKILRNCFLVHTISRRPAHRLRDLHKGDYVEFKFDIKQAGFQQGIVYKLDSKSGQVCIQCSWDDGNDYFYWVHRDSEDEIKQSTQIQNSLKPKSSKKRWSRRIKFPVKNNEKINNQYHKGDKLRIRHNNEWIQGKVIDKEHNWIEVHSVKRPNTIKYHVIRERKKIKRVMPQLETDNNDHNNNKNRKKNKKHSATKRSIHHIKHKDRNSKKRRKQ